MQTIFDTAGGRKMLLGILGILSMTLLAALKVIDGITAVETIKWVIIGVAGALAISDVGTGISNLRKPDPPAPMIPPVIGPPN